MRQINLIVIHCSASPNSDPLYRASLGAPGTLTPAQVIDSWHEKRGFSRSAAACNALNPHLPHIGYHYVIYRTGAIVTGRAIDEVGAHVQSQNAKSIGICLVGMDAFTQAQWDSLRDQVTRLQKAYPLARVVGHRDLSPDRNGDGKVDSGEWLKTCPGFDVGAWLVAGKTALPKHLV